jgi:adenylate kinase
MLAVCGDLVETSSRCDVALTVTGVSKIMKMMDWGDAAEFISFGAISKEDADCDADVFILVAPQNIVGNTIMTNLEEMVRFRTDC